eukprot:gene6220-7730_t
MKKPSASSPSRASKSDEGALKAGAVKMLGPRTPAPATDFLGVNIVASPAKGQASKAKNPATGVASASHREKYGKDHYAMRKGSGKAAVSKSLYGAML